MDKALPKDETIIDFEATKVKEAVNKFIELNQDSDFHVESRNDHTGYYVLNILKNNFWNGYSSGDMNISVREHEKTRTKIIVETQNTGMKDPENYEDLAEAQSQFLHALFNILTGNLSQKAVVIPKGKGCLGTLLILISIGIGSLYYLVY
jgi:hypothetical protein